MVNLAMNVPALGDSISEGTLTKWEAGGGTVT